MPKCLKVKKNGLWKWLPIFNFGLHCCIKTLRSGSDYRIANSIKYGWNLIVFRLTSGLDKIKPTTIHSSKLVMVACLLYNLRAVASASSTTMLFAWNNIVYMNGTYGLDDIDWTTNTTVLGYEANLATCIPSKYSNPVGWTAEGQAGWTWINRCNYEDLEG